MKSFLYFLVEEDGRTRQLVNGVVTSLGNRKPLPQTPDGWQDILIGWEVNEEAHGLIRNFSLPLGFVMDGGQILRNDWYKFNLNRVLYLLIYQFVTEVDATYFKQYYKYLYKGQLDFSTIEDKKSDYRVDINIMEGGIKQMLKAKENVEFFIPFDTDANNLLMDGIELAADFRAIVTNGDSMESSFYFFNHLAQLDLVTSETGVFGNSKSVPRQQVGNDNSAIHATGGWFLKMTTNGSVDLEWNFKISVEYTPSSPAINPAAVYRVVIRQLDASGNFVAQHELLNRSAGAGIPGNYTLTGSTTMAASSGDEFYLYTFCNVQGATGDAQLRTLYEVDDDTIFAAKFMYLHPESTIKIFKPEIFLKKLIEKITGDPDDAESEFLRNSTYCITSGDGIRGLEGAGVKTTLNQFLKAYDVVMFGGWGVESGKLIFAERAHFYNDTAPIALGRVNDLIIRPAPYGGSSIRVGHREQNIEDINGKFDFNGYHIYTTPMTVKPGEFLIQSPYKAGPYEIEITRMNLEGKTTTDASNDNDVFLIDVNTQPSDPVSVPGVSFTALNSFIFIPSSYPVLPGQTLRISGVTLNNGDFPVQAVITLFGQQIVSVFGVLQDEGPVTATIQTIAGETYTLRRPAYVPFTGVPSPATVFNVDLSPARILLRHGPWIRSWLYNYEPGALKFESSNRNSDLVAGTIAENSDFLISALGDRMFLPFVAEFSPRVPTNLVDVLESNPTQCFSFEDESGNIYTGFFRAGGLAPNTRKTQTFRLLLTPGNDPKLLI